MIQKITPFLWFDGNAEAAVKFYVGIFKKSKIKTVVRYGASGPGPQGSIMTIAFQLDGQEFVAINGGPQFKFSPAISFVVNCDTQAEVDKFWNKLSAGGKKIQCGWLTDKFGVTWQVVPAILPEILKSKDARKTDRVMKAVMKMGKLDNKKLKRAFASG